MIPARGSILKIDNRILAVIGQVTYYEHASRCVLCFYSEIQAGEEYLNQIRYPLSHVCNEQPIGSLTLSQFLMAYTVCVNTNQRQAQSKWMDTFGKYKSFQ